MTLQEKVIDGERVLVAETAEDLKAAINQDCPPVRCAPSIQGVLGDGFSATGTRSRSRQHRIELRRRTRL